MLTQFRPALILLISLAVMTGIIYPLLVTGIAQVAFPNQANGSLMDQDGRIVGSALIGQPFAAPKYFWGRLSATSPFPYNAAASSGSNLGPTSKNLLDAVQTRVAALRAADPGNTAPIPVDLVTASGSGLDPHISVAAALYQVPRIARKRGISKEVVYRLVMERIESRTFGILGEPRVNVLKLNLALDANP
jgi:K+-transporting ATPase ATPase C chain